jgi:putative transposase
MDWSAHRFCRSDPVGLTGEGGLLQQLTKVVLESALEGEVDAHLG